MIRITKLLVLACALALAGTAAAQTPPPPPEPTEPTEPAEPPEPPSPPDGTDPGYAEPPSETPPVAAGPRVRKIRIGVGLLAALPTGDNDDGNTSISPGFRGAVGYSFTPEVSVHALLRYTSVMFDEEPMDVSVSTTDLGVGARYTMATPSANFFGEATLCLSSLSASFMGFSASEDGLGFELRAGGAFNLSETMSLEVSASYLKAMISGDGGDSDVDWLSAHVDLAFLL